MAIGGDPSTYYVFKTSGCLFLFTSLAILLSKQIKGKIIAYCFTGKYSISPSSPEPESLSKPVEGTHAEHYLGQTDDTLVTHSQITDSAGCNKIQSIRI